MISQFHNETNQMICELDSTFKFLTAYLSLPVIIHHFISIS